MADFDGKSWTTLGQCSDLVVFSCSLVFLWGVVP
jgi:hypothetical protein